MWFRKKISQEDYVNILLESRVMLQEEATKIVAEDFNGTVDEKKLQYELMIFTLWIITLSMPPDSDEVKDLLHRTFSYQYWGVENNDPLFRQIDRRYKNYYAAFNEYQKSPQSGHLLGGVIVETLKNQNSTFSLSEELPSVGDIESLQYFMLFSSLFKQSLKIAKGLKKKYSVKGIS